MPHLLPRTGTSKPPRASAAFAAYQQARPAVQVPVDLGGISVAYNVMTLNSSLN
jgi:hypothetical protein